MSTVTKKEGSGALFALDIFKVIQQDCPAADQAFHAERRRAGAFGLG